MKIEVLGTGCYKCIQLETLLDEVVRQLGVASIEIVRVADEKQIRHYMPLDEIPGLLINGVLVSTNQVPSREKLVEWLSGVTVSGS